jgi:hypothetical protein
MVLLVEPNDHVAQSLAVAIERVRPGTPVTLVGDCAAALKVAMAGTPQSSPPRIAILGPGRDASADNPALRKALGAGVPLVAFARDSAGPVGVDAVYRYQLEWQPLQRTMAELLEQWLA